jgi:anthranilate synthase component 1
VAEAGQEALLEAMAADIQGLAEENASTDVAVALTEEPAARYLDGVQRIKHYIVEGDVFQVNLSRAWRGPLSHAVKPADLYQRLCQANPAPFAGLALFGESAIISSSPERLVRVCADVIEARPIAGTRPRRGADADDQALQAELLAHPKERAEHIMLIDLERNDLGRVCVPGSVTVDELMVLESYAHVHHIVSNVRGRLRPGVTPGQVIRAVFPGGTITGCPKVRCMEIIAELEGEGRGAYTGSMGYLNHDGSLDLNILIRTMTQHGQQLSLRAGAGIVADSDPQRELDETRAKARGLVLAVTEPPASG